MGRDRGGVAQALRLSPPALVVAVVFPEQVTAGRASRRSTAKFLGSRHDSSSSARSQLIPLTSSSTGASLARVLLRLIGALSPPGPPAFHSSSTRPGWPSRVSTDPMSVHQQSRPMASRYRTRAPNCPGWMPGLVSGGVPRARRDGPPGARTASGFSGVPISQVRLNRARLSCSTTRRGACVATLCARPPERP